MANNAFSDLWARAGSLARTAAAATRHAADSAKLSINIAAEEENLKKAYAALGRLYYEALDSGTTPEGEAFDQQIALIRQTLQKIELYRRQKEQAPRQESTGEAAVETTAVAEDAEEMTTVTADPLAKDEDFDDLVNRLG